MNFKLTIGILIATLFQSVLFGQSETYKVEKAAFSTDQYDEFSPVYYKNGLVFSTNRPETIISPYSTSLNEGLFDINFIDTITGDKWAEKSDFIQSLKYQLNIDTVPVLKPTDSRIFSKSLKTRFNDGPVTFSKNRDTIYFSRNTDVEGKIKDLSNVRNKLGLFSAVYDGTDWVKIRELRLNSEWYNITSPWLSPDGKRLFFASDKPGGLGGSDLYYSERNKDFWNDPVNLGPEINTKGNESYPFMNPAGELFFSSDGHKGFGGKDLFFTRLEDSVWLSPILLDSQINSEFDDFGLVTDSVMSSGYFSSNRDGSVDIFSFKTMIPQIFYTEIQIENQHCFIFRDTGSIVVDTLTLKYVWDFGDGKTAEGSTVSHCYEGSGQYKVRLDIKDRITGKLFFSKLSYNLDLRDFEQPYITSNNEVTKGESLEIDGLHSYLPGYEILNYSWDFGDGSKGQGAKVSHTYSQTGEYVINLGVTLRSNASEVIIRNGISKKISVKNETVTGSISSVSTATLKDLPDIMTFKNATIESVYSAENEFRSDAVFYIELLTTKTKNGPENSVLTKVPGKYSITENYNKEDSVYSYGVDQQISLMATLPAYRELIGLGFDNARIKIKVLSEPYEKELHNLIKNYGASVDSYFDSSNRLTSNAYIMLAQIVRLMDKYPAIRLEIAVHTDNTGSGETNVSFSKNRAQLLVNYLINRGISTKRLVAAGYGSSKPIASNQFEKDRKLNRRIDFTILKQ